MQKIKGKIKYKWCSHSNFRHSNIHKMEVSEAAQQLGGVVSVGVAEVLNGAFLSVVLCRMTAIPAWGGDFLPGGAREILHQPVRPPETRSISSQVSLPYLPVYDSGYSMDNKHSPYIIAA